MTNYYEYECTLNIIENINELAKNIQTFNYDMVRAIIGKRRDIYKECEEHSCSIGDLINLEQTPENEEKFEAVH